MRAKCQHPDCLAAGEPCFIDLNMLEPSLYYCLEHRVAHGFCTNCGLRLADLQEQAKNSGDLCLLCITELVEEDSPQALLNNSPIN